jgi:hypothetical protein
MGRLTPGQVYAETGRWGLDARPVDPSELSSGEFEAPGCRKAVRRADFRPRSSATGRTAPASSATSTGASETKEPICCAGNISLGGHADEGDSGRVDDEFCHAHSEHLRGRCQWQERQHDVRQARVSRILGVREAGRFKRIANDGRDCCKRDTG